MQRIRMIASGRVQGVGFRAFVQQTAISNRISGWTRNLPDGTVEIEAEGEEGSLDRLIQELKNSQGFIRVDELTITKMDPLKEQGFIIRR